MVAWSGFDLTGEAIWFWQPIRHRLTVVSRPKEESSDKSPCAFRSRARANSATTRRRSDAIALLPIRPGGGGNRGRTFCQAHTCPRESASPGLRRRRCPPPRSGRLRVHFPEAVRARLESDVWRSFEESFAASKKERWRQMKEARACHSEHPMPHLSGAVCTGSVSAWRRTFVLHQVQDDVYGATSEHVRSGRSLRRRCLYLIGRISVIAILRLLVRPDQPRAHDSGVM